MGKQIRIGNYAPNAFRENEAIQELYTAKREYWRRSIIAEKHGDAYTVMECTQMILDIDALISNLQLTAE
jgi:hypothetical protein